MQKRLLGYVGLANRAGQIVSGGSMVCDAIRGGHKPGLVLIATGCLRQHWEKIELLATVHHIACIRVMGKEDFGAILGKAPRSAIAIRAGGFVAQIEA